MTVKRKLLSGGGRYTDDVHLPAMLHMAVLRSPMAAAEVEHVDGAGARAVPGVVDVLTGAQIGHRPVPPFRSHPGLTAVLTPPVLAVDRVRYAGEPVAAVLAEDPYAAEDGAEAIAVRYRPLAAVASVEAAIAPGAPRVHERLPDNVGGRWRYAAGDAERAFATAAVKVALRVRLSRGHGNPLETRGCVARYDFATGELTVWVSHQAPHRLQEALGAVCGVPRHRVRVICPDIGGAFGLKLANYQEYFLAALFAMRTGRPVKWIEDRREHLLATTADRETLHDIEVAATADGVVLALRDRLWADLGAYAPMGLTGMQLCATHVCGPYRIRHIDIEARAVFTHRSPTGPYRGFGRPNGTFAIERAMDRLADDLGLDPAEVRRRNLISPAEMPWSVGITPPGAPPMTYDSGDYPALLERVLDRLDYAAQRRAQAAARREGRLVGIGIACYAEGNVGGAETVTVRLEPSGRVVALCGAPNIGQGAGSTWAGLVACELGLRPDEVDVVAGDTGAIPSGTGTFGSRTAVTAGNSAVLAARELAERIKRAASRCLECAPEDTELEGGAVRVRGVPGRSITLRDLWLKVAEGVVPLPPPGLQAEGQFALQGQTWSSGAHGVVLEVDPETARVQIRRFVAADDCGTILQPRLVEGQTIGGVAQGVGGSLYEHLAYDESGQLLSATFMDYLLPTACEVPRVEVLHGGTPSPLNPLGVKGAGEGGCMGCYAAIAAALEDALRPLGARITELPTTPGRLLALLAGAAREER